MREMTKPNETTAERTRNAFRECIRTLDSFAVGEVLHEYIVKTIGGMGGSPRLDTDTLGVLLRIVDSLRNPSPIKRTHPHSAIKALLSLASSLPKDPRGEPASRVHREVGRVV